MHSKLNNAKYIIEIHHDSVKKTLEYNDYPHSTCM